MAEAETSQFTLCHFEVVNIAIIILGSQQYCTKGVSSAFVDQTKNTRGSGSS